MAARALANAVIARTLREIGDALEIEGESTFRVRAYRTAAQVLGELAEPVADLAARGGAGALEALPGIGKSMAAKIVELLETGKLRQLEEVRREVPPGLSSLLAVSGLGPKRLRLLHERLGVRNLGDLERLVKGDQLLAVPGFGEKSRDKLRRAVARQRHLQGRLRLADAEPWVAAIQRHLAAVPGVRRVQVAGSFRRRRETVGDLDFLCVAARPAAAMRAFAGFEAVEEVLGAGSTKSSVRLANGLQVDLRIVDDAAFGAALHYFTGSKEHTVAIRTRLKEKGYKLSEYGAFRGSRRRAGRTEEEIFALLGAGYIPPELRENRGEIEAAISGELPELVELADLRGDLHMHTDATDGRDGAEAMVRAAKALGRSYVAITEHSQAVRIARGLDGPALLERCRALRDLQVPGIRVLTGVEVDILRDGTLDLPPEVLTELEVVVASVHSSFDLPAPQMTRRLLRAVESGLVHVLGHPTGRQIPEREPSAFDVGAVTAACARRGVALEINAQPHRLDLDDVLARAASRAGVKLVISSDAHSTGELALLRYGVDVARRAWLTRRDVLNTLPAARLLRALRR